MLKRPYGSYKFKTHIEGRAARIFFPGWEVKETDWHLVYIQWEND